MEDRVGYLIHAVRDRLRGRVEEALRPTGLTPAQFTLLRYIGEHPDLSAAELARRSLVTPQSGHEVVRELERAGLIARQGRPELGRVLLISVTPAGSALIQLSLPALAAIEEQLLANFSDRERTHLSRLLRRAFANLSAARVESDASTAG